MVAFLPPVSANRCIVGLLRSISAAVEVPPVRTTASTPSCETRREPTVPPLQSANCSAGLRTPARQKHLHNSYAIRTVSDAGLRMTLLPAARAAATPPQGIASGKFQGETTTTTPRPLTERPGKL